MAIAVEFSRASIRFPTSGHIWVPGSSARAAAAGLSMHSPCTAPAVLAHRLLFGAVRIVGARVLPGERASWPDPIDPDSWRECVRDWQELVGAWDSVALYQRPQQGRSGFSVLLLREGRGVGFVRVSPDHERAAHEFAVLEGLQRAEPESFTAARPLGFGTVDGYSWVASASVPNYPLGAVRQRAVRLRVIEEIGDVLETVLTHTAGQPTGWRGAHGDASPWNLRTDLLGRVIVIDWEDAGFAPAGADLLYADLTAQLTFRGQRAASSSPEAAEWVRALLSARRVDGEGADSINNRLLTALDAIPVQRGQATQQEADQL